MVEEDATQGLNRYSYCLNNPLSRTDPSGSISFRQVLGAAIAIAASVMGFGAATALGSFLWAVGGGFASAFISTGSLKAGFWGAVSAAVFWGIGNQFSNMATDSALASASETYETFMNTGLTGGQFAAQVAAHSAAGGTLKCCREGSSGTGFVSAGVTKALTPAINSAGKGNVVAGTVASAVVGGTASELSGGKFANGAQTAAFQFLFNEIATGWQSWGISDRISRSNFEPDTLEFDGSSLKWKDGYGELRESWMAVSGREGHRDPRQQSVPNKGPLPQGKWVVSQSEFQSMDGRSILDTIKSHFGRAWWREFVGPAARVVTSNGGNEDLRQVRILNSWRHLTRVRRMHRPYRQHGEFLAKIPIFWCRSVSDCEI